MGAEAETKKPDPSPASTQSAPIASVALAWLFVGVPLLWGIYQTLKKAAALFN